MAPLFIVLCLLTDAAYAQAPTVSRRPNSEQGGAAWWTNARLVGALGLTTDQQTKIERVFEMHKQELAAATQRLDLAEARLAALMEAESIDRGAARRQIDEVVRARGDVERANSTMAFEMREQLTRAQWLRLQAAIAYGPNGPYATAFVDDIRELTGTIREFQFTNPNARIQLIVDGPGGRNQEWSIVWSGAGRLQREGYSRSTFPAGARVTLRAHPMKDGSMTAGFVAARFPDGKTIGRWE